MTRYPLAQVTYGPEEIAAVNEALSDGQTTCGPRVAAFEGQFGASVGRKHAIMVNSGSSADLLIAFGLGPPAPTSEVLLPAVTWPTQVWSCILAGYHVRLVDVDPENLQMDQVDLARKIRPETRAVFPVHVLGNVGNMRTLDGIAKGYGLPVIEDCCEAMGSRFDGQHVGTFGQAAAFSFFFSHLINTMEGGMVVTDSPQADRLYRLWRSHGWEPKPSSHYWFPTWGLNVRPTELQGAFGTVQIGRMAGFQSARTRNYAQLILHTATRYPEFLREVSVLPECQPAWHGFALMVRRAAPFTRDSLCTYLDAHGVETRPIIAGNLARQPGVLRDARILHDPGGLPGADEVHECGFYIGLSSYDDTNGIAFVAQTIEDFIKSQ